MRSATGILTLNQTLGYQGRYALKRLHRAKLERKPFLLPLTTDVILQLQRFLYTQNVNVICFKSIDRSPTRI